MLFPLPFRTLFWTTLLTVTVLSLIPLDNIPAAGLLSDKLQHGLTYLLLALLGGRAFPDRNPLLRLLFLFLYGVGIESIQGMLPFRSFSLLDMAANGGGLLLYQGGRTMLAQHAPAPPGPATETTRPGQD